jgi:uncharacterized protein YecE (DUF72 family)
MSRVWIGTSGFSYKEWKGPFYPQGLPDSQMLTHYATRLCSVEIDSTFYRMPTAAILQKWADSTPPGFRFTIKAPQQITHRERLRTPSDATAHLTEIVPTLKDRCGLLCFQLPPFLRCDLERLDAFLKSLPQAIRYAFEFRHESWFVPEVYSRLREHGVVLCLHDADEGCTPEEVTGTAVYVRLRRSHYAPEGRELWRKKFLRWADSGVEVFAYVKHKDNPEAPRIALEFAEGFCGENRGQ